MKDRKEWRAIGFIYIFEFHTTIVACILIFWTALSHSGGLLPGEGGISYVFAVNFIHTCRI